jgi:hypothetical protein
MVGDIGSLEPGKLADLIAGSEPAAGHQEHELDSVPDEGGKDVWNADTMDEIGRARRTRPRGGWEEGQ